jgi:hypothetical protein
MATETLLTLKAKSPTDSSVTTSIRYINPDITNAMAKEYAQMLNALTQNTYDSLTKVTKEEIF